MIVDYCDSAEAESEWLSGEVRRPGQDVRLCVCHYARPAVIFGLSQRPDAALQQRLHAAGVSWMRRRAGGGTVYAGPWLLGVSLVLPAGHPLSALEPVHAYRWFGELWQSALASLGCDSRLPDEGLIRMSREDAASLGVDWACYGAMGHGELGSDETPMRKILGIAQIRTRTASTLVAGLNLQAVDWDQLCALLGKPPEQARQIARVNASLVDLVSAPIAASADALARQADTRFRAALRAALDD